MDGSQALQRRSVPARLVDPLLSPRACIDLLLRPFRDAKRTIVILSLALAGCRGPSAPISPSAEAITLRVFAESATHPLLQDLTANYRRAGIQFVWDVQVGEMNTLIAWLKAGDAAYALIDYVPDKGLDPTLWSTPIGEDGLAVIVHPSNPVSNLTAAQLRGILQGRVANWNAVGGPDLAITVIARDETSSTTALIQSMVLGDRQVTRAARLATTSQAMVDIVSANPGAIGYVSMGYMSTVVRAVPLDGVSLTPETVTAGQYPLRTPILFVGLREPSNDAYRTFFAWVQGPDGQAVVRQHYGSLAIH